MAITSCKAKSIVKELCLFSAKVNNSSTSDLLKMIGKMPFLKQLLKKISAKEGAIIQLMPKSSKAHGACSRLEPQPKLSRATKTCALEKGC